MSGGVVVWVGVALLGGLGATVRYLVHASIVRIDPDDFPLGTFTVNIAGSFALGLLAGAGAGHDARLLLGTGFLGALTTFSTWMFESERLAADGYARRAALNIALSLALGLGAAALGVQLAAHG